MCVDSVACIIDVAFGCIIFVMAYPIHSFGYANFL